MRIAVFTTDLYQGGVAESTRKIVNLLAAKHIVDLIIYDTPPIELPIDSSVRIYKLSAPLSVNFAKSKAGRMIKRSTRGIGLIYAFFYLLVYKFVCRPSHVYSLTYIPNLVNLATKTFFTNQKVIISERQDPRMDLRGATNFAKLLKHLYPSCDRIHVNSEGMEDAVKEFYGFDNSKIFRIDNFFDLRGILEQASEAIPDSVAHIFSRPVIISSGRLSKQKGHWHLLTAFTRVKSSHPDAELVLLGDGELKNELQQLCQSLGVESSVHFFGNVSNPHRFVARSAVFVFPSIWESFGNSLLEAMAVGTPVISSSCRSGPGEIIGFGSYGIDVGVLPD